MPNNLNCHNQYHNQLQSYINSSTTYMENFDSLCISINYFIDCNHPLPVLLTVLLFVLSIDSSSFQCITFSIELFVHRRTLKHFHYIHQCID